MTIRRKNKKAQEEIVGFVLIVVVVAVVFLIILGILIRQKPSTGENSLELSHFLRSVNQFNTNCIIDGSNYANIADLMGDCYENKQCDSGETSCDVLNDTMKNILEVSWPIKEGSNVKGYEFSSIYSENLTSSIKMDTITMISKGNCTFTQSGSDEPLAHRNGIITNTIKICY